MARRKKSDSGLKSAKEQADREDRKFPADSAMDADDVEFEFPADPLDEELLEIVERMIDDELQEMRKRP